MMAAIFIIMFVVGWNQYLWPIMMTTDEQYNTIVMGIKQILNNINETSLPRYDYAFAMVILAMLPIGFGGGDFPTLVCKRISRK